jgi:hypothetical protein
MAIININQRQGFFAIYYTGALYALFILLHREFKKPFHGGARATPTSIAVFPRLSGTLRVSRKSDPKDRFI